MLAELTARLGDATEARWVLAAACAVPATRLAATPEDAVPPAARTRASRMAERRAAGEPLQYVLGTWDFRTLEVAVDPRVLVPRPETEQVAGIALAELARVASRTTRPLVAVDLGTGSGVLALSLLAEGPAGLEVWATDRSDDALAVARHNVGRLDARMPGTASRLHLAAGAWFDAVPARLAGHVDLVVSNPPYVSATEWEELDPVVRDHEPRGALVSGPTGLEDLATLVDEAPRWLVPGGVLVLELAPGQATAVLAAARHRGYAYAAVEADLAGRERALVARTGT